MRPRYETSKNLSDEERLIRQVLPLQTIHKLPIRYKFDFFIAPNQVWEVKKRDAHYDTWVVSLGKVMAARSFEGCGVEAWALIEMKRHCYMMRFAETAIAHIAWGGRQDRGDAQDMEPVVHYRIADMLEAT